MSIALLPVFAFTVQSMTSLVLGGTVVAPTQYAATTSAGIGFDTSGDIFLGGNPAMRGTANVHVTLTAGLIQISEIQASIESATWTGAGTFVNPNTFQTVDVSVELVTDPTSFSIMTDQFFGLSSNAQGQLEWNSRQRFDGEISPVRFSGRYTLRGPTETATGTFGRVLTSNQFDTQGRLTTPNFPDEIELRGVVNAFFLTGTTLVSDTVDGIPIFLQTDGFRSGMGVNLGDLFGGESTTFTQIPEPASGVLVFLGMLVVLRRRR